MEEILNLTAESRKEVGKQVNRKLRKEGKIPAIIYGGDREAIPISILLSDIKKILKMEKGENTILRIHRDDIKVDAMLKMIQYDYLSDNIIHADFIRIDLEKPIEVNVPVVIQGEAIGVRIEDGIFDFVNREIRVKCIPTKIPKEIVVDVSDLHTGHSIKLEKLELEEDVEFLSDPQTVICAVTTKGMVEEEVVEEEEEEVEGEEEKEGEKKEEKEAAGTKEGAEEGKKEEKEAQKKESKEETPKHEK
jgi:large subunit ribosomal protein L25